MKSFIYFIALLLFSKISIFGSDINYNKQIDSINIVIEKAKPDSNKINEINKLTWFYINANDFINAQLSIHKAALLYKENTTKNNNLKNCLAGIFNNIAIILRQNGKYNQAIEYHLFASGIYKAIRNNNDLGVSYNNVGIIYDLQGNYPEALKYYLLSLKLFEGTGNKSGVAFAYNNIGVIYELQKDYPNALNNYCESLKIRKELEEKEQIAACYINIGNVYSNQKKLSEALENYFNSIEIYEKINNKVGRAIALLNIGNIYKEQGKLNDALKYSKESLLIFEETNYTEGIAISFMNLGSVYTSLKDYNRAKEYFDKSLLLFKSWGYNDGIKNNYLELAKMDSSRGNWENAYKYYKLYVVFRDSLLNEENLKKSLRLQMNYEFDKKEAVTKANHDKQLAVNEANQKRQQIIILFIVSALLLVIIFAGFIWRSLKITKNQKKIIELQKNEVEQQKMVVEYQKGLVEEHQKEIIDSIIYAKRLQLAILPSIDQYSIAFSDFFVLYKPKDIVAGDFYWMEIKDDVVYIACADCTGHGVPGAIVSVVCSNALNRTVRELNIKETGKILDKVTDLVLETFEKSNVNVKDGMDISFLSYNIKNKQLQWSGANNPLWYIHDGELKEIVANKQPVGKFENRKPFSQHNIEYSENDTFYLFSDGFADQFGGPKGKKFLYKRLAESLKSISAQCLKDQEKKLEEIFIEWKGDQEQVDDVTIIGIKF